MGGAFDRFEGLGVTRSAQQDLHGVRHSAKPQRGVSRTSRLVVRHHRVGGQTFSSLSIRRFHVCDSLRELSCRAISIILLRF